MRTLLAASRNLSIQTRIPGCMRDTRTKHGSTFSRTFTTRMSKAGIMNLVLSLPALRSTRLKTDPCVSQLR